MAARASALALLLLAVLVPAAVPQQQLHSELGFLSGAGAGEGNARDGARKTAGGRAVRAFGLQSAAGRQRRQRREADPAADKGREEEEDTGVKPRPKAKKKEAKAPAAKAAVRLPPMPRALHPTLVVYVFHDRTGEHNDRLALFLTLGMQRDDGVTYRVLVPRKRREPTAWERGAPLPELPPNAAYVKVDYSACVGASPGSPWAPLAAALPQLEAAVAGKEFIVVVDSEVTGPFLPPYARQNLHWTDAFTSRLDATTKLAGAFISCEGTPAGGAAGGQWRRNPYVMPHAWATDQAGWALLSGKEAGVLECRGGGYWDARYYGDSGASLAILQAGWNLASLMTRYQGVDWRDEANWGCNERVRPDRMWMHDGTTPAVYETVFAPLSDGQGRPYLSQRPAIKYGEWAKSPADLESNEFLDEGFSDQSVRGELAMPLHVLRGGSACFDRDHYLKVNPELEPLITSCLGNLCGFDLFDHYMTMGLFQGRLFRFNCSVPQLSREQQVLLAAAQGRACFNASAYRAEGGQGLEGITDPAQLWWHYVAHGQFESRKASFVCGDALYGLAAGLDGSTAEELERERRQHLQKLLVGSVATRARPVGGAASSEVLQQAAAHQPVQEPEPQPGLEEQPQQQQEEEKAEVLMEDLPM